MAETFDMIAKTFFGLEQVLADELTALGALDVQLGRRMVSFTGDKRLMMLANLACRTAVRVLVPIASFSAADEQALYRGVGLVDWLTHMTAEGSLAIDPVVHSSVFTNSLYTAQLAKDAIVDQIRQRTGRRPAVDLVSPKLRINLHIDQDRVTVYLDSSGDSLHKRGYRAAAGEAPINEVLAAGILKLTDWDACSPLVDIMCGSGTFVIEGALMARRIAPGLVRRQWGYMHWPNFERSEHDSLLAELKRQQLPRLDFPLLGSDLDSEVLSLARENARRAGVADDVEWRESSFEAAAPLAAGGTLVTNPPYDVRMKTAQLEAVYRRLGDAFKQHWPGYTAYVFTGNLAAAKQIGLRASARIPLFNGPIECRLLKFVLFASTRNEAAADVEEQSPDGGLAREGKQDQATAFANRLSRMAKHWHRWGRRQSVNAYRLYDRDIPEIPLSIDWYDGHVLVTEHERPHSRTEIEHRRWLADVARWIADTLDVPPERTTFNARVTGQPSRAKLSAEPQHVVVNEGDLRFEVRLTHARETGLEIDQRTLRTMLRGEAQGKRFLNLFGRAGAATVAAAAGGASETTTVDASRALLDVAQANLQLNGLLDARQHLVCENPLEYLAALNEADRPRFDLVLVQPGSFDGKRREGVWNVQDGHAELLNRLLTPLSVGGKIYFVTTFRRLTFQESQIRGATVREITRQSVPQDFRNKKVHRAWTLLRTDETLR